MPAYTDAALLVVGPPLNEEQRQMLQESGVGSRVHQVGFLDDADLAAAYRGALALIFPSLQEGFGWPVAEAQMCACPVFASNLAPMPEVGGTAARYFDPARPAQAAELIAHAPLDAMRAEGQLNAQRYTLAHLARVFGT
jgi:glycosyltransferase involved in cell wall biosynthesis